MSNGHDGERQTPYPLSTEGKGYSKALKSRSQAILQSLQGLLASNYKSNIPSTTYSQYLRAISLELGRLTLALEELSSDISFDDVRSEFLYQVVGYLIFRDGEFPDHDMDDEGFKTFLLSIIGMFFKGSTPSTLEDAVRLVTSEDFNVIEMFKNSKDISDQFGFQIQIVTDENRFPTDPFKLQYNLSLLLNIIKPAHTLYTSSFRFEESYDALKIEGSDEMSWSMNDYRYEEVRKYWQGLKGFTSYTGYVEVTSLDTMKDSQKLLGKVKEGSELIIFSGTNAGRYKVLRSDESWIKVHPRFKINETNITYSVEVHDLGQKREREKSENVSSQFVSPHKLKTKILGEYSSPPNTIIEVQAVVNTGQEVTAYWDLSGNGQFDDAVGLKVPYEVGHLTPHSYPIAVKVVSKDGRIAKDYSKVNTWVQVQDYAESKILNGVSGIEANDIITFIESQVLNGISGLEANEGIDFVETSSLDGVSGTISNDQLGYGEFETSQLDGVSGTISNDVFTYLESNILNGVSGTTSTESVGQDFSESNTLSSISGLEADEGIDFVETSSLDGVSGTISNESIGQDFNESNVLQGVSGIEHNETYTVPQQNSLGGLSGVNSNESIEYLEATTLSGISGIEANEGIEFIEVTTLSGESGVLSNDEFEYDAEDMNTNFTDDFEVGGDPEVED